MTFNKKGHDNSPPSPTSPTTTEDSGFESLSGGKMTIASSSSQLERLKIPKLSNIHAFILSKMASGPAKDKFLRELIDYETKGIYTSSPPPSCVGKIMPIEPVCMNLQSPKTFKV